MNFVYFIRNKKNKRIKIGYSRDPDARLTALQTGAASRLELLGYVAGGRKSECLIHELLAEHRVDGEWFIETYPVKDFTQVAITCGLPVAIEKYERIRIQRMESIAQGKVKIYPRSSVVIRGKTLWEATMMFYEFGFSYQESFGIASALREHHILKSENIPTGMRFGVPIPFTVAAISPEPTP